MPRIARITISNGYYHIITRGNQKQPVFMDDSDYEKYVSLLSKYKKRYKFKLYCFCLMPNHVHLIMEVTNPLNLKRIMHGLNLSYTIYFNSKYKKIGHLWQDRFKSKIIQGTDYLLECIKYIENNPVRTSLTSKLSQYKWSSYVSKGRKNQLLDNLYSI